MALIAEFWHTNQGNHGTDGDLLLDRGTFLSKTFPITHSDSSRLTTNILTTATFLGDSVGMAPGLELGVVSNKEKLGSAAKVRRGRGRVGVSSQHRFDGLWGDAQRVGLVGDQRRGLLLGLGVGHRLHADLRQLRLQLLPSRLLRLLLQLLLVDVMQNAGAKSVALHVDHGGGSVSAHQREEEAQGWPEALHKLKYCSQFFFNGSKSIFLNSKSSTSEA